MARESEVKMVGTTRKPLFFRSKPEKGDNVIKILAKDHTVKVIEDQGEWLKIKEGKKEGYVMAQYVAVAPEVPEEPGTEETEEPETKEADGDE